MLLRLVGLLMICLFATSRSAQSGDWPQILGPNRDGVAADEKLNVRWTGGTPPLVWKHSLGKGFAGVAVRGDKLVCVHRLGNEDVTECLDAATGRPLWKRSFPAKYVATISYDDGPRCVPTLTESRAILYSADGVLRCLDLSNGEPSWSVATHDVYGAQPGYFGAGSSPLVLGDRVIVNVGADRRGAGVVAFAIADGKELWKATDQQASYSSPIAVERDGVTHLLVVTRLEFVSLDPANGAARFRYRFGKSGPTVNAANPLTVDGKLFLTASYGIGAVYATFSDSAFTPVWSSDDVLSSQYATPVRVGKSLFGLHGRQDVGLPELRCIDPAGQKVFWSQELSAYGSLIAASGKLLVFTVAGELIVIEASTQGYLETARASLQDPTPNGSALPALANGRVYVRDAELLRCYDLRP